jgi:hypothetical protein
LSDNSAEKKACDRQWHKAVGNANYYSAEEVDRANTALRLLAGML